MIAPPRFATVLGIAGTVVLMAAGCSVTTAGTPVDSGGGGAVVGGQGGNGGQGGRGGKGGKGGKGGIGGRDGADGADGAPG